MTPGDVWGRSLTFRYWEAFCRSCDSVRDLISDLITRLLLPRRRQSVLSGMRPLRAKRRYHAHQFCWELSSRIASQEFGKKRFICKFRLSRLKMANDSRYARGRRYPR